MQSFNFWAYQPETKTLELSSEALPKLNKREVLVQNHAIGINPVDWKFIDANPLSWQKNHIPGVDGAGQIIAVADENDANLIGKRVCYHSFLKTNGSFSTHSVIKSERLMLLPDAMPYSLAAALPCPMLTAYQAFEKIPLQKNKSVLIAGWGAVTKILAQLLIKNKFDVDVISKYMTKESAEALGIRALIRDEQSIKQTYFAAFDAINEKNAINLTKHLKANGHIICIQDRINIPVDPAFTRTISYHEIALGALHEFGDKEAWIELMQNGEQILNDINEELLIIEKPVEFSFGKLNQALVHSKNTREKTIVTL